MRSVRADVRNPILQLPSVAQLQALPVESQAALRAVLKDIATDARQRAEKCWRTHKAPMAAYWKAVAVYANHTSRVLHAGVRRACPRCNGSGKVALTSFVDPTKTIDKSCGVCRGSGKLPR